MIATVMQQSRTLYVENVNSNHYRLSGCHIYTTPDHPPSIRVFFNGY